jgi:diadenosine tetraphosphate (Ap4A) HIT family hydrolase
MLAETAHSTVVLSAYPRRWGHVLVVLAEHVTTFAALSAAAWADAAAHARVAARVVERVLAPERCYVASLGTAIDGLELTFPHIHLHVIPVYDPDDRPSTVLSTADGMLAADEDEWEALHAQLRAAWP